MISYFTMSLTCNGKYLLVLFSSIVLIFFVAMDTHLYFTLQKTSLVHQDKKIPGAFSPFKPLTMKLIMTDPYNHYIMGPSAEYFDEITKFSKVFYFITPNMISITHVIMSFISAKLVSHENLCHRRMGVLLYQFRSWLDDLDGVVYRSHSHTRGQYQSNHNTLGYFVDIYSDIIGGIVLFVGILFYLFKVLPIANGKQAYSPLPLTKPQENGSITPAPNTSPSRKFNFNFLSALTATPERPSHGYTKRYLFYKVACTGVCVFLASGTWDKVVEKYTEIFQTDLKDPVLEVGISFTGISKLVLISFHNVQIGGVYLV